ncbi:MAG: hypothetical protein ACK55E_15370 [Cyanobacteriota bacterium]
MIAHQFKVHAATAGQTNLLPYQVTKSSVIAIQLEPRRWLHLGW